ncbi:MAG: hypothetical protein PF517_17245 [Salinivirgaceae bacterium]|jgi:hypothetical protein|nr:hypothetical protein [Salinivirgaceae bacterium]
MLKNGLQIFEQFVCSSRSKPAMNRIVGLFIALFLTSIFSILLGRLGFFIQSGGGSSFFAYFGVLIFSAAISTIFMIGSFAFAFTSVNWHNLRNPFLLALIAALCYMVLNLFLGFFRPSYHSFLFPFFQGFLYFIGFTFMIDRIKSAKSAIFLAYFSVSIVVAIMQAFQIFNGGFIVTNLIVSALSGLLLAYILPFSYSIVKVNFNEEVYLISDDVIPETEETTVSNQETVSISIDNIDLSTAQNIICINMARTPADKIINYFHPSLNPFYAVKLEDSNLLFHRVKKGKLVQKVVGYTDITFDIALSEIASFEKNSFLISFMYNVMMPRYEMTLKNGQTIHFCFFKGQKMFGKQFNGDEKDRILNVLLNKN